MESVGYQQTDLIVEEIKENENEPPHIHYEKSAKSWKAGNEG